MKLYELMYEQQPSKVTTVSSLHKNRSGNWMNWFLRHLSMTGDHADFNRKI